MRLIQSHLLRVFNFSTDIHAFYHFSDFQLKLVPFKISKIVQERLKVFVYQNSRPHSFKSHGKSS